MTSKTALFLCAVIFAGCLTCRAQVPASSVHVIEVLADKDSRFKIVDEKKPEITVKESGDVGLDFIIKTRLTRVELVTLSSVD